ncbi:MAG: DNA mismatch repair protein MutS [Candidatus Cloacimonetes bacterium]|nr:DNA mismatch repair protein MutS [Candidatus Cloacimonadota bacterium]
MIRQYQEIKQRFPGLVLFYRMGDFYEMFFDDARIAHEVLGISLTSRGQHKGEDVPLAGFPYHALEPYLTRMVKAGYRVAICEQVEDPRKAKGLVKRDVVEVVTAGTNFTPAVIGSADNNFLAALCPVGGAFALAWADLTTGEFRTGEYSERDLRMLLSGLEPAEILLPRGSHKQLTALCGKAVCTRMEDWFFDTETARRDLLEHFGTASLKGFGIEQLPGAIAACGALLSYAKENLRRQLEHLVSIRRYDIKGNLQLDPSTRRNLELVRSLSGDSGPTLLGVLDRSITPMGHRLLVSRLHAIPARLDVIRERQTAIGQLIPNSSSCDTLQRELARVGDLERMIARLAAGKANARDVVQLGQALETLPGIRDCLGFAQDGLLAELRDKLDPLPEVTTWIRETLVSSPALSLTNGGLIRDGVSPVLDELREILVSGKDWIRGVEQAERERSGIQSLKIRFNKVFGYYIEISRSNLDKVPENYIRRQTLANAERYVTPELKEQEEKVLHAEERIGILELDLFQALVDRIRPHYSVLQRNAAALARLDWLQSLAAVAQRQNWCCPELVESGEMHLHQARHPVIETVLPPGETFVPNDVILSSSREQVLLITGPNMAGKSTYLRMVGLITLLAHMGSWVPATRATIPVRDQIFTRVGASDNLAKGESTFLVEMNEAAYILNNATSASLVLLDEIGRGTSTFDGLSLAWAITEYLHERPGSQALTLFATHYHELVDLESSLVRLRNFNIRVKEFGDRVIFTREVVPGGCSHSYGIEVARMAGIPPTVIQRAREVLSRLEANEYTRDMTPSLQQRSLEPSRVAEQLTLFQSPDSDLRELLRRADLENLTPLQAMSLLIELRSLL